jgi:hypothetical protein
MARARQTSIARDKKPATDSPMAQLKKVSSKRPRLDSGKGAAGAVPSLEEAAESDFLDLKEKKDM